MIRLNAGNDTNGNPRRAYIHFGDRMVIRAVYDEGYSGSRCVPKRLWKAAQHAPTFSTTPAEYRHLLKEYGKAGG
jgi:hypothetical protein